MSVITVEVGVDEFSNDDLIEELEGRGFYVHKEMTEEEKLTVRIDRTRKILTNINELYWHDFADLSAMLEVCIDILDGKDKTMTDAGYRD